jgi:NAD(P)-dependent dehydrogenase (short-subunit alcohol dehydrogenase family)
VNLSSILNNGGKGRALRSASKAALASLTRAMALDHGSQNIRVNAVLVGPTLTRDIMARTEQVQRLVEEAPLGQLHTPDDVAAAVYFLASDEARRITGALLPLDAGRSLPTV